jgi:hypothetical protein
MHCFVLARQISTLEIVRLLAFSSLCFFFGVDSFREENKSFSRLNLAKLHVVKLHVLTHIILFAYHTCRHAHAYLMKSLLCLFSEQTCECIVEVHT